MEVIVTIVIVSGFIFSLLTGRIQPTYIYRGYKVNNPFTKYHGHPTRKINLNGWEI